ncbi:hypothetical protein LP418_13140 [Nocardioides sp. B-3]|nr:hypothetical protein LP418_13140 [Nocardioides sp. B-3]
MLGLLNIGLFFPLIFVSAYHLPGGLASTVRAGSPLVVMAVARLVIGERAALARVAAAFIGIAGVTLLVLKSPDGVTALGLAGAIGSVLVSALGFVLIKSWTPPVDMITLVSPAACRRRPGPAPRRPHRRGRAAGRRPLGGARLCPDRDRRHRPRLRLLVHRPARHAGRGRIPDRPAQPGGGYGAGRRVRP